LDGAGAVLDHNHNCKTGPAVTLVTNDAMTVEHGATTDDVPNAYGAGHFGGSGPGDGTLDLSAGKGKGDVFDIYEILSSARTGDTTSVWDDWKGTLNLNGQSAPTSMSYIGLLLNAAYADQCSTSSQLGVTKWTMKTQFMHTTNRFGTTARRALEVTNVSTHEHEFIHVPAKRRMQEDTPDNVTAASTAVVSGRTGTCQDGYAQVSETSPFSAACVCKDSLVASSACHAMLNAEDVSPPPPPPEDDEDESSWFLWLLLGVTVAITLAIVVEVRSGQRSMHKELKDDIMERSRGKYHR
jgi:hypothetical protein